MRLVKYEKKSCYPCAIMDRVLENVLPKEFPHLELKKVDVEENREEAASRGINIVPVIILEDGEGREVSRLVGGKTQRMFSEWLNHHL